MTNQLHAMKHTLAQESESSLAVHHALDQFYPRDMALDLTVIDLPPRYV